LKLDEKYGALYELVGDAILVYDPESRLVLDVNERACGTYGIPREKFVGKSVVDLWVDPEREARTLHTVASQGSYLEFETVHRRDGGEPISLSVNSSLIDFQGRLAVLSVNRELTEARRAEARLRETEAKYRTLVEQIPVAVYIQEIERDNAISYISPQIEAIMGYSPKEYLTDPKLWVRSTHPDDRDKVLAEDARTIRTGEPFSMEFRKITRDGRVIWVRDEAVLVRDEGGSPRYWQGILADITERKHTEEALRESERRFRQLFENSSDALFVHDEKGRFVDCNAEACRALGYSREELLELSVADVAKWLLSEEDRPKEGRTLWERALGGEPGRIVGFEENELVRKDGSSFPVEVGVGAIEYWGRRMIFASARDISERKRVEDALREGEAKYRTLVEQIPAVTYIEELDVGEPEWNMVYVSPQVEALLGYTPDEYMSDPKIWEELLHPDDRERVLAEDARTEITGEPFRVQYRILTREGDIAWIRDEAILVRDQEGRPLFWQGVMYDVTDQKRAEEEVRRLNEGLERRVAERTAQLEAYAEKLRRSNRELQDFAYIASHDLQEPLRKVLTFGDRLKAMYGEALGEEGRDYLQRMEGAAARMRDLVDDLLTLSRITTQARPFFPVDLTEVAEEVVSDLEARIEEVGGRVEVGELPTIEADRLQMRQLLQNLIGNGLKFHKGGEAPVVEVRAEVIEERRRGGSDVPVGGGLCHIRVKDNGIGFDEEHLERIFMPFQRLHGRNVYEGTGMGLAICRKVVERHCGKITAESAPGRGATFTVTLPLVQPGRDSWTGKDELGHHATPGR
ncbi:MAG: PAS domain S-box protein, partial [Actinomycetota bacterium]|nr:PAS domain S-box protein [Actinomycetota bacterium]